MNSLPNREFRRMARVEDARRRFLKAVPMAGTKRTELVPLREARGRVLARQVNATKHLPSFNLSVVDGYAVRSSDLRTASPTKPVWLRLKGESRLGQVCRMRIRSGETLAVATGSMTPKESDAVVMAEDTEEGKFGSVQFQSRVDRWQCITRRGEDVTPGSVVLEAGKRLRPEDIGSLKVLGLQRVRVVRRVCVGLLSTGNELTNSAIKGNRAKIVDLNRPILKAMLEELGADVLDVGIVRDEKRAIMAALRRALAKSDLVLVTAGSSVGKRDLVPACINSLGRPGMVVHGVAMRPAMPTGLAVVRGKPVVSLPGFPVSAMIAFRVFVRPVLARLSGGAEPSEAMVKGVLTEKIRGSPGQRMFVRVRVRRLGGKYSVMPLKLQRSSILSSMVRANGIVTVPESVRAFDAGTEVSVVLTGEVPT